MPDVIAEYSPHVHVPISFTASAIIFSKVEANLGWLGPHQGLTYFIPPLPGYRTGLSINPETQSCSASACYIFSVFIDTVHFMCLYLRLINRPPIATTAAVVAVVVTALEEHLPTGRQLANC